MLSQAIMLGLRLRKGVDFECLQKRFEVDTKEVFKKQIVLLQKRKLFIVSKQAIKLSVKGLDLENQVASEFLI